MKIAKTGWAENGYTIIEVMIFLAVSGFMFVLAAVFINGKQASVAYRQGVTAAAAAVTASVNAVANGEYPALPLNISCQAGAYGAPTFHKTVGGDSQQGTNNQCVFLGEALQFGFGSDKTNYETYTIVGRQYASGASGGDDNRPSSSLADAQPVAAYDSGILDLTQTSALEDGLSFERAYLCNDANCTAHSDIGGVAFFGDFGSYNGGTSDHSSGAQSVSVATLPTAGDENEMRYNIKKLTDSDVLGSQQHVLLCFKHGDKNGAVLIGGQGGQQTETSFAYGRSGPC